MIHLDGERSVTACFVIFLRTQVIYHEYVRCLMDLECTLCHEHKLLVCELQVLHLASRQYSTLLFLAWAVGVLLHLPTGNLLFFVKIGE